MEIKFTYLDTFSNDLYTRDATLADNILRRRAERFRAMQAQHTSGPQWSPAKTTMLCSAMFWVSIYSDRMQLRLVETQMADFVDGGRMFVIACEREVQSGDAPPPPNPRSEVSGVCLAGVWLA